VEHGLQKSKGAQISCQGFVVSTPVDEYKDLPVVFFIKHRKAAGIGLCGFNLLQFQPEGFFVFMVGVQTAVLSPNAKSVEKIQYIL
jgi:hypothetical protein